MKTLNDLDRDMSSSYSSLENIRIEKVGKIKLIKDIFPQFSSIEAFYSLKDNSASFEFMINGISYSSNYSGKYVYLKEVDNENFHESAWLCQFLRGRKSVQLFESWIEDIHDRIVYTDSKGEESVDFNENMLAFLERVERLQNDK